MVACREVSNPNVARVESAVGVDGMAEGYRYHARGMAVAQALRRWVGYERQIPWAPRWWRQAME